MRATPYILTLLATATALLALVAPSGARQPAELTKQQAKLYNTVLASSSGYLDVDTTEFQSLIHAPRDFAVTLLLTATDSTIKCGPCKTFQPEFDNVARAWNRKTNPNRTKNIFVKAEFARAKELFRLFQLQHAPVLYTFGATADVQPPEPASYDFNRLGFDAVDVATHMARTLDVEFSYTKPPNYKLIAASVTAVVILASTALFLAPYLSSLVKSAKPIWMIICLAAIIIFNSGQMWNQIRNAPYVAAGRDGSVTYFASGFQNQYGAETQIVAVICEYGKALYTVSCAYRSLL